jgi:hypothetical protein
MSDKRRITRRQFIKDASLAAAGSTLLLGSGGTFLTGSEKEKTATVVLVRDKAVLDENGNPKYEVVLEMLDTAITTLTGRKDPVEAWKSFIKPTDIVGIKTNIWKHIPTTPQVENALKKRVKDIGVGDAHIGIDDRGVLRNHIFKKATALINARPMRSHHWSGVGTLIKNYIMFTPQPWKYHDDSCADLAAVWNLPPVKGKTRLNVLVMLTPQFHSVGAHSFSPRYVWRYFGLLAGFDPVAVDATGVRIIQAKRRDFFKEERPLNPPPKHIFLADTRHHLGTADPNKIKLVKIGYQQDLLI